MGLIVDVARTPQELASHDLADMAVIVVDVLRATTSIITALANGCRKVVPVDDLNQAFALRASGTILAGERNGERPPGFDLGNSPGEFTEAAVRGKTVVLTTTNGTRSLLAAAGAACVAVGGLTNMTACARWATASERDIVILCAGEQGAPCLEDDVCAAMLVRRIISFDGRREVKPGALSVTERPGEDPIATIRTAPWALRLIAMGRRSDVDLAVAADTSDIVPIARRSGGWLVITR